MRRGGAHADHHGSSNRINLRDDYRESNGKDSSFERELWGILRWLVKNPLADGGIKEDVSSDGPDTDTGEPHRLPDGDAGEEGTAPGRSQQRQCHPLSPSHEFTTLASIGGRWSQEVTPARVLDTMSVMMMLGAGTRG